MKNFLFNFDPNINCGLRFLILVVNAQQPVSIFYLLEIYGT